jgi:hypothetical protein
MLAMLSFSTALEVPATTRQEKFPIQIRKKEIQVFIGGVYNVFLENHGNLHHNYKK